MTLRPVLPVALVAVLALSACANDAATPGRDVDFSNIDDRPTLEQVAYLFGYQAGKQFHDDSTLNIDPDVFIAAFREGLAGDSMRFSEDEAGRIMAAFEDTVFLRQLSDAAAENPQAAEMLSGIRRGAASADSFLTANARRDSVETTESGLQYVVLTEGDGPSPSRGDRVKIAYVGTFLNGTEFDRSPDGQPAEFVVGSAIPGMNEALMDMQAGERRRLFIPPALAYGTRGIQGSPIGPNSLLVFDVTLLEVMPAGATLPFQTPGQPTPAPAN